MFRLIKEKNKQSFRGQQFFKQACVNAFKNLVEGEGESGVQFADYGFFNIIRAFAQAGVRCTNFDKRMLIDKQFAC